MYWRIFVYLFCLSLPAVAEPLTRSAALSIAQAYAEHRWSATGQNVRHGIDRAGVEVNTPNATSADGDRRLWSIGANVGVPYKWGGFDSLESFNSGIAAGKAAGDLYSAEKRRKGGSAVSPYAVGIDCSGFISRCWMLSKKYSTDSLVSLCRQLPSARELLPADIMNTEGGHVLLFVKFMDDSKTSALFYEAEPFSKVILQEHSIEEMLASGYRPYRYKQIRD